MSAPRNWIERKGIERKSTGREWSDRKMQTIIAVLLRAGVILAAVVVIAGAAIYLLRHGSSPADYRVFRGEPTDLRRISGILGDALHLRGRGVIQLGLLLLIATPVARVAFAVFGFAVERDRLYVAITLFVLAVLGYSLLGGGY